MKKLLSLLFVAGMLWSNTALATVAWIDVNYTAPSLPTYTGPGVIGQAGDQWNAVKWSNVGSSVSLVDVNGSSTGASVVSHFDGISYNYSTGFDGTVYENLMKGYAVGYSESSYTIDFSGLNRSTTYDIYLLSQGDYVSSGRRLSASVNGMTYTTVPTVASASSFIPNQNYLQFSGTSDASGNLTISYWAAADEANINGIQLAVPEPASVVLLGVGGIAVAMAARRKELAA